MLKFAFLPALLLTAIPAFALDLEDYGNPATIILTAQSADITQQDGVYSIVLNDTGKLASIAAQVHQHHERTFSAFPVSEFADVWNRCNMYKAANGLFHDDGINALITFSEGPASHAVLDGAPLITKHDEPVEAKFEGAGTVFAMLTNASYDNASLAFTVKGKNIVPGSYERISVVTECLR